VKRLSLHQPSSQPAKDVANTGIRQARCRQRPSLSPRCISHMGPMYNGGGGGAHGEVEETKEVEQTVTTIVDDSDTCQWGEAALT